jgi:hypothetical protein
MRYGQPRPLEKSKLWHFTERIDETVYPVGYCAEECPGHETEQEAREHFAQWQRDKATVNPFVWERPECEVPGCKESALYEVRIPRRVTPTLVCTEHSGNLDQVIHGCDYSTS